MGAHEAHIKPGIYTAPKGTPHSSFPSAEWVYAGPSEEFEWNGETDLFAEFMRVDIEPVQQTPIMQDLTEDKDTTIQRLAHEAEEWRKIVQGSVVRVWVLQLPLRHQGVLLSAIRSCDTSHKDPLATDRCLTAWLRYLILNPADQREVGILGAFMRAEPPSHEWKQSEFGEFPLHYVSHLMHAFQIVAHRHPDRKTAEAAYDIYLKFVHGLHLRPEPEASMHMRLTEDRVAQGNVVS